MYKHEHMDNMCLSLYGMTYDKHVTERDRIQNYPKKQTYLSQRLKIN